MRMLLVEDDAAIVASLTDLLRSEGYETRCADGQDAAVELLSRIRSVLRRTSAASSLLRLGDVEIDAGTACVRKAGRDLALTALEYRLLLLFAQSRGKLVTREHVRNAIWDSAGEYVSDNTLSVYVKRLRDKVEDDPAEPRLILTVRGLGYRTGA